MLFFGLFAERLLIALGFFAEKSVVEWSLLIADGDS